MTRMEEFLRDASGHELTLPVDHLSATQISMLNRCPEQYRNRYVLGKKERPGAALIVGGAFHEAIETDFAWKISNGELLDESFVEAAYHRAFDNRIDELGGVGEIVWDEREKPDVARKHGQLCVEQYHSQVAPKLEPSEVEHEFSKQIPGVPVPVVGKIDFVGRRPHYETTGPDGNLTGDVARYKPLVADYKTANKAQRTIKPDWRLQGLTYQWVSNRPVEWHVAVKSSKPHIITPLEAPALLQELEPDHSFIERQYTVAAKQIGWLMREFGPDESWPTNGVSHPWACGFCGYRNDCIAWRR